MPSVEVTAIALWEIATNTPLPYATAFQFAFGRVLCVQVIPSVEEAVVDELYATAAKTGVYKNDLMLAEAEIPRIGIRFLRRYVD
jgi:hypothetical protein